MITLSGNNEIHPLNLTGKALSLGTSIMTVDVQLEKLKGKIMNRLILPILQKNWTEVYENIFIVSYSPCNFNKVFFTWEIAIYFNYKVFSSRI